MQTKRLLDVGRVGIDAESLPTPVDLSAVFGNANPVELEIGCGKGTFITRQAAARPGTNFLGIEWAKFYWRYTCDRLRRNGCEINARCLRVDAGEFVRERLAEASLAAIHVYFPDPWPKTRHHRRRLIGPAFVEAAARALVPGGRLHVVTDHAEYAEHIEETLRAGPLAVADFEGVAGAGGVREGEVVGTNFERKYIAEGRIFRGWTGVKEGR